MPNNEDRDFINKLNTAFGSFLQDDRLARKAGRKVFSTSSEKSRTGLNKDIKDIANALKSKKFAQIAAGQISSLSGLSDKEKSQVASIVASAIKQGAQYSPDMLKQVVEAVLTNSVFDKQLTELNKKLDTLNVNTKAYKDTKKEIEGIEGLKKSNIKELENAITNVKGLGDAAENTSSGIDELGNVTKESSKKVKESFDKISDVAGKLNTVLSSNVNTAKNILSGFETSIMTRLSLTDQTSFYTSIKSIANNISGLGTIKLSNYFNNMNKLVDQGIAENVESRAFLATVAESVATTFNAFDSNLVRLIRIQAADSTAARLGMEAALNEFLTVTYKDTQYLSGVSTNVRNAILEAISLLDEQSALTTQYTIEKWLGAMTAAGVSSGTVEAIAQGLGYLGSGNVSALYSNTALQNLMAMGASVAGLDYSSLLTGGLGAETTNTLLYGITSYLQSMGTADNNVTRAALGQAFGTSMSDIRAIQNLSDLGTISSESLSYNEAIGMLKSQMGLAPSRYSLMSQYGTGVENIATAVGLGTITSRTATNVMLIADATSAVANKVSELMGGALTTGGLIAEGVGLVGSLVSGATKLIAGFGAITSGVEKLFNTMAGKSEDTLWNIYSGLSGSVTDSTTRLARANVNALTGFGSAANIEYVEPTADTGSGGTTTAGVDESQLENYQHVIISSFDEYAYTQQLNVLKTELIEGLANALVGQPLVTGQVAGGPGIGGEFGTTGTSLYSVQDLVDLIMRNQLQVNVNNSQLDPIPVVIQE